LALNNQTSEPILRFLRLELQFSQEYFENLKSNWFLKSAFVFAKKILFCYGLKRQGFVYLCPHTDFDKFTILQVVRGLPEPAVKRSTATERVCLGVLGSSYLLAFEDRRD
jgi:hypothetical protein